MANTKVRQISDKAGVSFGNFHYHFGGKNGLLIEALKQLLEQMEMLTQEGVEKSEIPSERLIQFIEAQFHPSIFTNKNTVIWLNFWNEATTNESFSRFETMNRERFRANFQHHLQACGITEQTNEMIVDMHAFIDGLWMHKALMKDDFSAEEALAAVRRKLRTVIG